MDADGIEQLLPKEFSQFLGTIDTIDEDDHLVEGKSIKQMGQFFKLLILVDVDVELGQAMEDELALIDEDIHLVIQELLAILLHLLRHSGTEHHHLLVVGSLDENILHVSSHFGIAQHLVAFVHHEEFALH